MLLTVCAFLSFAPVRIFSLIDNRTLTFMVRYENGSSYSGPLYLVAENKTNPADVQVWCVPINDGGAVFTLPVDPTAYRLTAVVIPECIYNDPNAWKEFFPDAVSTLPSCAVDFAEVYPTVVEIGNASAPMPLTTFSFDLCFPVGLLAALLFSASFLSGSSPFRALNLGAIKLRAPIRLSPSSRIIYGGKTISRMMTSVGILSNKLKNLHDEGKANLKENIKEWAKDTKKRLSTSVRYIKSATGQTLTAVKGLAKKHQPTGGGAPQPQPAPQPSTPQEKTRWQELKDNTSTIWAEAKTVASFDWRSFRDDLLFGLLQKGTWWLVGQIHYIIGNEIIPPGWKIVFYRALYALTKWLTYELSPFILHPLVTYRYIKDRWDQFTNENTPSAAVSDRSNEIKTFYAHLRRFLKALMEGTLLPVYYGQTAIKVVHEDGTIKVLIRGSDGEWREIKSSQQTTIKWGNKTITVFVVTTTNGETYYFTPDGGVYNEEKFEQYLKESLGLPDACDVDVSIENGKLNIKITLTMGNEKIVVKTIEQITYGSDSDQSKTKTVIKIEDQDGKTYFIINKTVIKIEDQDGKTYFIINKKVIDPTDKKSLKKELGVEEISMESGEINDFTIDSVKYGKDPSSSKSYNAGPLSFDLAESNFLTVEFVDAAAFANGIVREEGQYFKLALGVGDGKYITWDARGKSWRHLTKENGQFKLDVEDTKNATTNLLYMGYDPGTEILYVKEDSAYVVGLVYVTQIHTLFDLQTDDNTVIAFELYGTNQDNSQPSMSVYNIDLKNVVTTNDPLSFNFSQDLDPHGLLKDDEVLEGVLTKLNEMDEISGIGLYTQHDFTSDQQREFDNVIDKLTSASTSTGQDIYDIIRTEIGDDKLNLFYSYLIVMAADPSTSDDKRAKIQAVINTLILDTKESGATNLSKGRFLNQIAILPMLAGESQYASTIYLPNKPIMQVLDPTRWEKGKVKEVGESEMPDDIKGALQDIPDEIKQNATLLKVGDHYYLKTSDGKYYRIAQKITDVNGEVHYFYNVNTDFFENNKPELHRVKNSTGIIRGKYNDLVLIKTEWEENGERKEGLQIGDEKLTKLDTAPAFNHNYITKTFETADGQVTVYFNKADGKLRYVKVGEGYYEADVNTTLTKDNIRAKSMLVNGNSVIFQLGDKTFVAAGKKVYEITKMPYYGERISAMPTITDDGKILFTFSNRFNQYAGLFDFDHETGKLKFVAEGVMPVNNHAPKKVDTSAELPLADANTWINYNHIDLSKIVGVERAEIVIGDQTSAANNQPSTQEAIVYDLGNNLGVAYDASDKAMVVKKENNQWKKTDKALDPSQVNQLRAIEFLREHFSSIIGANGFKSISVESGQGFTRFSITMAAPQQSQTSGDSATASQPKEYSFTAEIVGDSVIFSIDDKNYKTYKQIYNDAAQQQGIKPPIEFVEPSTRITSVEKTSNGTIKVEDADGNTYEITSNGTIKVEDADGNTYEINEENITTMTIPKLQATITYTKGTKIVKIKDKNGDTYEISGDTVIIKDAKGNQTNQMTMQEFKQQYSEIANKAETAIELSESAESITTGLDMINVSDLPSGVKLHQKSGKWVVEKDNVTVLEYDPSTRKIRLTTPSRVERAVKSIYTLMKQHKDIKKVDINNGKVHLYSSKGDDITSQYNIGDLQSVAGVIKELSIDRTAFYKRSKQRTINITAVDLNTYTVKITHTSEEMSIKINREPDPKGTNYDELKQTVVSIDYSQRIRATADLGVDPTKGYRLADPYITVLPKPEGATTLQSVGRVQPFDGDHALVNFVYTGLAFGRQIVVSSEPMHITQNGQTKGISSPALIIDDQTITFNTKKLMPAIKQGINQFESSKNPPNNDDVPLSYSAGGVKIGNQTYNMKLHLRAVRNANGEIIRYDVITRLDNGENAVDLTLMSVLNQSIRTAQAGIRMNRTTHNGRDIWQPSIFIIDNRWGFGDWKIQGGFYPVDKLAAQIQQPGVTEGPVTVILKRDQLGINGKSISAKSKPFVDKTTGEVDAVFNIDDQNIYVPAGFIHDSNDLEHVDQAQLVYTDDGWKLLSKYSYEYSIPTSTTPTSTRAGLGSPGWAREENIPVLSTIELQRPEVENFYKTFGQAHIMADKDENIGLEYARAITSQGAYSLSRFEFKDQNQPVTMALQIDATNPLEVARREAGVQETVQNLMERGTLQNVQSLRWEEKEETIKVGDVEQHIAVPTITVANADGTTQSVEIGQWQQLQDGNKSYSVRNITFTDSSGKTITIQEKIEGDKHYYQLPKQRDWKPWDDIKQTLQQKGFGTVAQLLAEDDIQKVIRSAPSGSIRIGDTSEQFAKPQFDALNDLLGNEGARIIIGQDKTSIPIRQPYMEKSRYTFGNPMLNIRSDLPPGPGEYIYENNLFYPLPHGQRPPLHYHTYIIDNSNFPTISSSIIYSKKPPLELARQPNQVTDLDKEIVDLLMPPSMIDVSRYGQKRLHSLNLAFARSRFLQLLSEAQQMELLQKRYERGFMSMGPRM